ncbi:TonB-dependent receptor [Draconibacterium orientale]|uniref:SusC/RagA family TonB-linked outer membrane protein n=1 Tax=Draconibacterium orientale TaxID=1168034 RepID=UPI002ABD51FA|nr:TonB-dependent receptor [Draconibacterium orientale]
MNINRYKEMLKRALLVCFSLMSFCLFANQVKGEIPGSEKNIAMKPQDSRVVTGTVTDEKGEPLVGATVVVDGTLDGTVTNFDGAFSLKVAEGVDKLKVTFIGFKQLVVDIAGKSEVSIVLESSYSEIDEVVVVGYGTVKKRDLIGAVDQIGEEALEGRVNPSVTRSLQGQIPNLNITMTSGKPSASPSYNIRGKTSIGAGGSALVLIDGVEGDPNSVNPDDVESISVLKDASSAAVYGARGTFGVVLITTKKAKKGKVQVKYDGNYTIYSRTVEPSFVTNGYEWTTNFLSAYQGYNDYNGSDPTSINNIFPFTRDWYNELKRRDENPELPKIRVNNDGRYEYFGNTDWTSLLYDDYVQGTEHKVSVNGGSELASYYVSGRFFTQDGIYRYGDDDISRFNFRAKGDIKISPKLTLNNNFSMDNTAYDFPLMSYGDELVQRNLEHQGYPVAMMYNPDGTYTYSAIYNGVGDFANGTSYQDDKTMNVRNTLGFVYEPLESLTVKGDFTYSHKNYRRIRVNRYAPYSEGPELFGEKGQSLRRMWNQETSYMGSNLTLDYKPNLGENHSLNLLAGVNVEDSKQRRYYNRRDGYLYPDKTNFLLMDGTNYFIEERSTDWGFIGVFARANYAYKGRYLFEFSTRYDGSSKFPTNEQWGMFPSGSFGWRISDEPFMENTKNWLTNLKLRVSAGTLGNGNVSAYDFLELMSVSKTSTLLAGNYQTETEMPSTVPDNLTWEKATTYNLGLDADFFDGRLSMGFDIYQRNTTDMYTVGPELPEVYGESAPKGNYADLKTNGWELVVGWKNRTTVANRNLSYSFKFMLWDSQSEIMKYIGNDINSLSSYYEGQKVGEIWGYTIDGLFESLDEIATHADQDIFAVSKGRIWLPGDLKFADLDDSGKIDKGNNTLDDHGDLSVIGNSEARYNFGVNMGANYAGFGLSLFFQGVAKRDWYPDVESGYFWGQFNRQYGYYPTDQVGNTWIEGVNEDPNAYWPRLRAYSATSSSKTLGNANNRYMQNAAYVRLKNVTLDYSLPEKVVDKLKLGDVKFYMSGENLWTLTGLTKHTTNFDPEVIESGDSEFASNSNRENGYSYPMLKSVTVGVKVTF